MEVFSKCDQICSKPFHPTDPFLYLLKTSKKQDFQEDPKNV